MRNISRGNSFIIITHNIIISIIIIIIPYNYIGTEKSFEFDYESIELERSSPAPEASRMSTDADFSRFTLENY